MIEQMEGNSRKVKKEEEDDFGDGKFAKYQKMIWDLMEKSETSTAAQVGNFFFNRLHFKYPGGLSDINVFCGCFYCWNGDQHNATVEVNRRRGEPGGKPKTSHD